MTFDRPKTQSEIKRDLRATDWFTHLEVLILRNQGWEFGQIGDKLGISKQAVYSKWRKVKDMTVEQVQELKELYN